jgi:hypothetical protein
MKSSIMPHCPLASMDEVISSASSPLSYVVSMDEDS